MSNTLAPSTLITAGTIVPYLGGVQTTPPNGWLYCDGSYVSRSTYADLFSALGSTYGSSTSSDFRLPSSGTLMRGGSAIALGQTTLTHHHSYNVTITGNSSSESGHGHNLDAPGTSYYVDNTHSHSQTNYPYTGANTNQNFLAVAGSANFLAGDSHTHLIYHSYGNASGSHAHGGIVGSVGGGNTHSHSYSASTSFASPSESAIPPSYYIWYIIKT